MVGLHQRHSNHHLTYSIGHSPQLFYGPFSGTTRGEPVPEKNFWTLWCKGNQQRQTHRLSIHSAQIKSRLKTAPAKTNCLLLHPFDGLFSRTTWASQHQKAILDFTGARDDGVAVASAGSYANHLHLALDR